MPYRIEAFYPPPDLSPEDEKEILKNIKLELQNLVIREFVIKPSVKNYNDNETYVVYDKREVFVYDGNLHRIRLAKKQVKSFFISKPDRHV